MPDSKYEIPEPKLGVDDNFDQANKRINIIKEELNAYLIKLRKD